MTDLENVSDGSSEEDASQAPAPLIDRLTPLGEPLPEALRVQISYELIRLLSEQLYSSPAKAIEELVVNAWDADAETCSVHVPAAGESAPIVVFDNGHGMDLAGLKDLWMVGASRKRDADRSVTPNRRQIGKFGIGKLATYAVANRITYITRTAERILSVSVDFTIFSSSEEAGGSVAPVEVDVIESSPQELGVDDAFRDLAELVNQDPTALCAEDDQSWTFVVLENLKPAAQKLTTPRLEWIFRTAMPLDSNFSLLLNGQQVDSVDEDVEWVVDFKVAELADDRLNDLSQKTEEQWERDGDVLRCAALPNGVTGRVRVARESLYRPTTKRADLGRSHGYFVRVLGRLVNEEDPLFGLKPRSYQTFNRFIAQVDADDLDEDLTAPREAVERSTARLVFEELLGALFSQARTQYDDYLHEKAEQERRKKESDRSFVSPGLVEHPVADAVVAAEVYEDQGEEWTLVRFDADPSKTEALVQELYGDQTQRRSYRYRYEERGRGERLVLFDPDDRAFILNEEHPVVVEFGEVKGRARELVELLATSEAMLEIYLREAGVATGQVRQIIERHDQLLRSLAQERSYSPAALARSLRESQYHDKEYEAALVAAMRLLGFTTRHVSGSDNPDGIAEFFDGDKTIILTLEAKSSETGGEVSLSRLGFDGLRSHADEEEAAGCLLLATAYPGDSMTGQAARRARTNKVSCWTTEDLARVIEATERRHLTTREVLEIVLKDFAPGEVAAAIEHLLATPGWTQTELRSTVLDELIELTGRVAGVQPDVSAIAMSLAANSQFQGVKADEVRDALETLASASAGGLHLGTDKRAFLRVDGDELRRRVAHLVDGDLTPRRPGAFRQTES